ncbi:hypothetical protein KM043_018416 [Ampulex compressa]|nr:hypothetical protein KM043_018416 [Ampulex compressa]
MSLKERSRWDNYLERTQLVYTVLPLIYVVGALIFVFSPLVLPKRVIPLNTVYLLPIDECWGWSVTYALNIFSIMQASVAIIVDLIVITILWYTTFKFELVGMKMRNAENEWQLREYAVLHQQSIKYVLVIIFYWLSSDT